LPLGFVVLAFQAKDKMQIDSENENGALALGWRNDSLFNHVTTTLPVCLGYATESIAAARETSSGRDEAFFEKRNIQ
jgi:hypothetical protein